MKKLTLPLLFLLLAVSCTSSPVAEDLLRSFDKSLPMVVDHSFTDNRTLTVTYSETVEVVEILTDGVSLPSGYLGKTITITLPRTLSAGEKARVNLTVRKTNGNTARASFLVAGVNLNLPVLLLNEVSIKGTSSAPDRIELLVTEDGNLLGMELASSSEGIVLPDIDVRKGDLVVVYWNARTSRTKETKEDGRDTFYVNGGAKATLPGTNGLITLSQCPGGTVVDALVYSDYISSEHSWMGSEKLETALGSLVENGAWSGEPADSSNVTSSRVLVRLPGGVDSDTASDWFTSAARKSTFGEKNTYSPYEE